MAASAAAPARETAQQAAAVPHSGRAAVATGASIEPLRPQTFAKPKAAPRQCAGYISAGSTHSRPNAPDIQNLPASAAAVIAGCEKAARGAIWERA